MNDESLGMGEEMENQASTVSLIDEDGRSLTCYVERSMEVDGSEYLLLMPVDVPINIFAWDVDDEDEEEETLFDIEDDEVDDVFDTAKAVLAEQDMILQRTALTLTATGEVPEPGEDDVITLDVGEEDEEITQEQFQLLANFFYEEQEYAICTPFEPLLFFARMNGDGRPELLSPEEFQLVRSELEDQLFDELE